MNQRTSGRSLVGMVLTAGLAAVLWMGSFFASGCGVGGPGGGRHPIPTPVLPPGLTVPAPTPDPGVGSTIGDPTFTDAEIAAGIAPTNVHIVDLNADFSANPTAVKIFTVTPPVEGTRFDQVFRFQLDQGQIVGLSVASVNGKATGTVIVHADGSPLAVDQDYATGAYSATADVAGTYYVLVKNNDAADATVTAVFTTPQAPPFSFEALQTAVDNAQPVAIDQPVTFVDSIPFGTYLATEFVPTNQGVMSVQASLDASAGAVTLITLLKNSDRSWSVARVGDGIVRFGQNQTVIVIEYVTSGTGGNVRLDAGVFADAWASPVFGGFVGGYPGSDIVWTYSPPASGPATVSFGGVHDVQGRIEIFDPYGNLIAEGHNNDDSGASLQVTAGNLVVGQSYMIRFTQLDSHTEIIGYEREYYYDEDGYRRYRDGDPIYAYVSDEILLQIFGGYRNAQASRVAAAVNRTDTGRNAGRKRVPIGTLQAQPLDSVVMGQSSATPVKWTTLRPVRADGASSRPPVQQRRK